MMGEGKSPSFIISCIMSVPAIFDILFRMKNGGISAAINVAVSPPSSKLPHGSTAIKLGVMGKGKKIVSALFSESNHPTNAYRQITEYILMMVIMFARSDITDYSMSIEEANKVVVKPSGLDHDVLVFIRERWHIEE